MASLSKNTHVSKRDGTASVTVAVIGGGIMGASVAYYLNDLAPHRSTDVTVFEAVSVACAASGKAGGFLASDWCSTPVDSLARHSFELHKDLAEKMQGQHREIEYRPVEAYSISLATCDTRALGCKDGPVSNLSKLSWLDAKLQPSASEKASPPTLIGTRSSCAQVNPKLLTQALMECAGATVRIGKVTDVKKSDNSSHSSKPWVVHFRGNNEEDTTFDADVVVLCMGPWTTDACGWFPDLAPVIAQKAASVIVHGTRDIPATVLFSNVTDRHGAVREPEIYPRVDELYMCQTAASDDLPRHAGDVSVNQKDVDDLIHLGSNLNRQTAHQISHGRFTSQACYLPIATDDIPMIGPVPGARGVFVAAGHSCWGILNGPATGKGLAQMILTGKCTLLDMDPFSPCRFSNSQVDE